MNWLRDGDVGELLTLQVEEEIYRHSSGSTQMLLPMRLELVNLVKRFSV